MNNKAYLYRKNSNEKQVSIIGLNEDLGCFSCMGRYLGNLSLEKVLSAQFSTLSFKNNYLRQVSTVDIKPSVINEKYSSVIYSLGEVG